MTAVSQDFSLDRLQRIWELAHDEVVWRHDVDFSPACAVAMAAHETAAGIRSTFYIRLRGFDYNPFAKDTRRLIRSIAHTYGHRLGLHLDLEMARDAHPDFRVVAEAAERDFGILRSAIPELDRRVSLHAPPHKARWRHIPGFVVADAPEWEGRYVSDSRGLWKESPEDRINEGVPLQVNTHSEWYYLGKDERAALHAQEMLAP